MTEKQVYTNQYQFTPAENRRFARANLAKLVYTNAHFEGVKLTLTETQTILDGVSVAGVSVADVLTLVNLKRGWLFALDQTGPLTLELELEMQLNKLVAAENTVFAGELRSRQGGVNLGDGEIFAQPLIDKQQEVAFLQQTLANQRTTTTDKALTVMYHNMRQQIFWDGNKRAAVISANKIMIDGGAGLINVPLDKWGKWNELIADYYRTNDMTKVKQWTYEHAIQGVDVRKA